MGRVFSLPEDIWDLIIGQVDAGAAFSRGHACFTLAPVCRAFRKLVKRRTAWLDAPGRSRAVRIDALRTAVDPFLGTSLLRTLAVERRMLTVLGRTSVRAAIARYRDGEFHFESLVRRDTLPLSCAPRPMPFRRVRELAVELLKSATAMHAAGVAHGRICADRVFVDPCDGGVLFVDFRFVQLLNHHALVPIRMPRTRRSGGGFPADAWDLGALVYELGHGKRASRTPDFDAGWRGSDLERAVRGLLLPSEGERYSPARALACLGVPSSPARPPCAPSAAIVVDDLAGWVGFFDDALAAARDRCSVLAMLMPCASALRALHRRGGVVADIRASGIACLVVLCKLQGVECRSVLEHLGGATRLTMRSIVRVLNELDFDLLPHHDFVHARTRDPAVFAAALKVPEAFDASREELARALSDALCARDGHSAAISSPSMLHRLAVAWIRTPCERDLGEACRRRVGEP